MHGPLGRASREELGGAPSGDEEAEPPGFPRIESLSAANQRIHEKAGQPERFELDQPSPLESALDRARTAYESTDKGRIRTAALLAHGIAQAQAFRDGNRRTAYWATHAFLEANGLGHLMKKDDHMMTRYLNQVVENQSRSKPGPSPAKFEALFSRRRK